MYACASATLPSDSSSTVRGLLSSTVAILRRTESWALDTSSRTSAEMYPSHDPAVSPARIRRVAARRSSGPGSHTAPRTDVSRYSFRRTVVAPKKRPRTSRPPLDSPSSPQDRGPQGSWQGAGGPEELELVRQT